MKKAGKQRPKMTNWDGLFLVTLLWTAHLGVEASQKSLRDDDDGHVRAMKSVDEALAPSANLYEKLKREWPEASSAALHVGSSADLLHEMKAEALSRLQQKVQRELDQGRAESTEDFGATQHPSPAAQLQELVQDWVS